MINFLKKYYFISRQIILFVFFCIFKSQKLKKSKVIFFFPFYHTGGAEQVHLDIVKSLKNAENTVFFSGKSSSKKYFLDFKSNCNIFEINDFLRIKALNPYLIKHIAKIINKNKIKVFGCNCHFFYMILPHLNQSIKKIDLLHAFSTPDFGFEQISIPSIEYLDNRIVINEKTKQDFIKQYKSLKISHKFANRILKIQNGISIIQNNFHKTQENTIKIGFVGRWSFEKRPELFLEIANSFKENYFVEFFIIGSNMKNQEKIITENGVNFIGEILENQLLKKQYQDLDILLVTSIREGFPMVIMEAMSFGVVVISTNVGGINEHISNNENGILIENHDNVLLIKNDFINQINNLLQNKLLLEKLANNSISYSKQHFDIQEFNKNYQELLN